MRRLTAGSSDDMQVRSESVRRPERLRRRAKAILRKRGEVTIRFFEIDTHEVLLEERAENVLRLHLAMPAVGHPDPLTSQAARTTIDRMVDRRSQHASCARAFHDLWLSDNVLAREFPEAGLAYLESVAR